MSCEQAIFVLHDVRVDNITEQLYFYSMNSTIQWYLVICPKIDALVEKLLSLSFGFKFSNLGQNDQVHRIMYIDKF